MSATNTGIGEPEGRARGECWEGKVPCEFQVPHLQIKSKKTYLPDLLQGLKKVIFRRVLLLGTTGEMEGTLGAWQQHIYGNGIRGIAFLALGSRWRLTSMEKKSREKKRKERKTDYVILEFFSLIISNYVQWIVPTQFWTVNKIHSTAASTE